MRKKHNLKKFGHEAKSERQRSEYQSSLEEQDEKASTVEESPEQKTDFEETAGIESEVVEGEDISPKPERPPYRSARTQLQDHWVQIVLAAFLAGLIALISWGLSRVLDNTLGISRHGERIEDLEEDLNETQDELSIVRDRSIQSETLLETIVDRVINIGDKK